MKSNSPKPIRVEDAGGSITVLPSLRQTLQHFGIQSNQLQRALRSGKPIIKGPRKGMTFTYETPRG